MSADVDVILCDSVVKELDELSAYNVLVTDILPVEAVTSDVTDFTEVTIASQSVQTNPENGTDSSVIFTEVVMDNDKESFRSAQVADESLENAWALAAGGKDNFYVQDGLLYHRNKVLGQKVNQLCLPRSKINDVC